MVVDSLKCSAQIVEKENIQNWIGTLSRKSSNLKIFVKNHRFGQKWSILLKNIKFERYEDTVPIRCYISSFSTLRD